MGVTWEDVAGMADSEVYDLLFPAQRAAREAYAEPDWEWVHSELQRDGVTLKLLWEELRDEAARDGMVAKGYNTFCRGYKSWVAARGVTNHLEHKPGQVMEVDWNGTPMWLTDPATGDVTKCHLFVATLPYSQYSYVEATLDMRQNTWLMCHVHAWDFFGGVAVRTVCDNLKTGVTSHPREGEIVLNEAYEALGAHYMTAIMPTGVRKPKQKASVEGTCGKVATAIVARLRNRAFATLAELNVAAREMLDAFKSGPRRTSRSAPPPSRSGSEARAWPPIPGSGPTSGGATAPTGPTCPRSSRGRPSGTTRGSCAGRARWGRTRTSSYRAYSPT